MVLDRVTRAFFHRFEPSIDILLLFGTLDPCCELLEGHTCNSGGVMKLEKLLVAVVIWGAQ